MTDPVRLSIEQRRDQAHDPQQAVERELAKRKHPSHGGRP